MKTLIILVFSFLPKNSHDLSASTSEVNGHGASVVLQFYSPSYEKKESETFTTLATYLGYHNKRKIHLFGFFHV